MENVVNCDCLKIEMLMRKIDEEEYYQGKIIIAYENNNNPIKDDYFMVVVYDYDYDRIRKQLKNDTYVLLSSVIINKLYCQNLKYQI